MMSLRGIDGLPTAGGIGSVHHGNLLGSVLASQLISTTDNSLFRNKSSAAW